MHIQFSQTGRSGASRPPTLALHPGGWIVPNGTTGPRAGGLVRDKIPTSAVA